MHFPRPTIDGCDKEDLTSDETESLTGKEITVKYLIFASSLFLRKNPRDSRNYSAREN